MTLTVSVNRSYMPTTVTHFFIYFSFSKMKVSTAFTLLTRTALMFGHEWLEVTGFTVKIPAFSRRSNVILREKRRNLLVIRNFRAENLKYCWKKKKKLSVNFYLLKC